MYQGNAERKGDRRSRRETAVDESREEMGDRVAGHQADKKVKNDHTTLNSFMVPQLDRMWSSLVFSFGICYLSSVFLALIPRDFHLIFSLPFFI